MTLDYISVTKYLLRSMFCGGPPYRCGHFRHKQNITFSQFGNICFSAAGIRDGGTVVLVLIVVFHSLIIFIFVAGIRDGGIGGYAVDLRLVVLHILQVSIILVS